MPEEEAVPLEPDLIKVLASDTRREVLRLLRERRMTLSEIARSTSLQKATVLEHLGKLQHAGLVERHDDERVWVYYSLTRRGERILSPGRTRFYLILGTAIAATAFGMLLLFALQNVGDAPDAQDAPTLDGRDASVGKSTLMLTVTDAEAYSGGPVEFRGVLQDENAAPPAEAYLLTAEGAGSLRVGRAATGLPLTVDAVPAEKSGGTDTTGASGDWAASDGADGADDGDAAGAPSSANAVSFRAAGGLPGGTYYLYVRDADGRDNLDALVPVHVQPLTVSPSAFAFVRGVTGDVALDLARGDAPVNGTLRVADSNVTAPVVNGKATLNATRVDALASRTAALQYRSLDAAEWVTVDATVRVSDPPVAVVPAEAVAGRPVTLHVGVPDADLRVGGTRLGGTTAAGWTTASWTPDAPGPVTLHVGRLAARELTVHRDLGLDVTTVDDATLRVAVRADGVPAHDAALFLDGSPVALDANATATVPRPGAGEHVVRVVTGDGLVAARAFRVLEDGNLTLSPAAPVTLAATAAPDGSVLRVNVTSASPAPARFTVLALANGTPVASEAVLVGANASASVDLRVGLAPGAHPLDVRVQPLHVLAVTLDGEESADEYVGTVAQAAVTLDVARPALDVVGDDAPDSPFVPLRLFSPPPASGDASDRAPEGMDGSSAVPAPGALLAVAAVALAAFAGARRRGR